MWLSMFLLISFNSSMLRPDNTFLLRVSTNFFILDLCSSGKLFHFSNGIS